MTWHPAYNSHSLVACKGNKDYGIPLNWRGMDFCRYFPFSVQFNSYQTSLMEFLISSSWDKFLKSIKLRLLYADKGLQCLEYQRARHCSVWDLWNKKQSIEVNDKNRIWYNVSKKKISLQISWSIFLGKKNGRRNNHTQCACIVQSPWWLESTEHTVTRGCMRCFILLSQLGSKERFGRLKSAMKMRKSN